MIQVPPSKGGFPHAPLSLIKLYAQEMGKELVPILILTDMKNADQSKCEVTKMGEKKFEKNWSPALASGLLF